MRSYSLANLYIMFISTISTTFSTNYKPTTINLTQSIFQHLDPDCDLIIGHYNNSQNFDLLFPPLPSKRGIYIFHLPQINISLASIRPDKISRGIY